MCEFFAFVTKGDGKPIYADWKIRKSLSDKSKADSHDWLADHFGFHGLESDRLNKYEFNPLTGKLNIDHVGSLHDACLIKKEMKKLDFKEIVPVFVIKPIVHPFHLKPPKIGRGHIMLLKEWASVRASVRASVGDSVRDSVWASVRASVGDSVRASVGDSVRASVGDSVGDSVRASVGDSVRAYIGSFFNLPRKEWKYTENIKSKGYPFQPAINLWEQGLVPSFDWKTWRLHGGSKGKVMFEIGKDELKKKFGVD